MTITQAEIARYAEQGYNRVPVSVEVVADLDTPLSVYLKLARGPFSYLLESYPGEEKWSRYSMIGLQARTRVVVHGTTLEVITDDEVVEQVETDDPLTFIESFQQRYKVAPVENLPRFFGGLVGFFGYDTVRFVEKRLRDSAPPDELNTPDILLMLSEEVVIFDNVRGRMQLVSLLDVDDAGRLDEVVASLHTRAKGLASAVPNLQRTQSNRPTAEQDFVSQFGEQPFRDAVERIREYVRAGDVMQVVLSQRLSTPFSADPIDLYRSLRALNPSPYMYFMDLDDFQIVSSSPEILARVEDGEITNRPLAGTRRRGHTDEEDKAFEEELLNDPKEIAEHLMLIDLGRNDVGRVAQIGSVEVTEQFVLERYSHVMHISSNVVGKLLEGKTAIDVLRATLPVGTLSGAPKIRAMEIIDELEPVKRGVYGGAVGYLAWNGNMDMAIAIRTAVIKDGLLHIQAGGGIVADSINRLEWKESMNKARAIFAAVEIAESDFSR